MSGMSTEEAPMPMQAHEAVFAFGRAPGCAPSELCVNLCEITPPNASADEIEILVAKACVDAGFPHCERVYVGSHFCENYFCALDDNFHKAVSEFCNRHDAHATLAVPVFGQRTLNKGRRFIARALERFEAYDEAAANDVACYLDMNSHYEQRLGLGRLFSKVMRDARIETMVEGITKPELSAEALECLDAARKRREALVIELDPTAAVVNVERIAQVAPEATIALHLPYCYATTGRNCTAASIDKPVEQKFHLGQPCELQCLGMRQTWRTDQGVPYVKHGRTFFFENPGCAIAGAPSWRLVYA